MIIRHSGLLFWAHPVQRHILHQVQQLVLRMRL